MKEKSGGKFRNKCLFFGVISLVILGTINIWGIFYFSKNKTVYTGSEYSLLNPARNIYDQDDLIINFQPIRDYLNETYGNNSNVSIYFEYLNTGANISINKDAEFWPASLLKVPVAMATAKKIERGDWKWTNELVLMSADKDNKFGTLYKEQTGKTFTIEDLVRRSLEESDNTAYYMLLRNLESEEISEVYNHIGLSEYLISSGEISSKKYSVILRALYYSSYLSEDNSQKIISLLLRSKFNDYLQGGLDDNIKFAHKIGIEREKRVFLDSGIVYYKKRPYLITVMIKADFEADAVNMMKDISEHIFSYVKNYKDI